MRVQSTPKVNGLINLAEGSEEGFFKKAILCMTGSWLGMNGPVDVTRVMLEAIAAKYNEEREEAINQNDYAPILKDHNRLVDMIQGRVDISKNKLSVVEHPKKKGVFCLIGDLRVDDEDGQKNVKSGKYAQLSLSFDDETFDIYEVSFVAVEAARGSQILSQGVKVANKKKGTQQSLSLVVAKNKSVNLALVQGVDKGATKISELAAQVVAVKASIKTATLKAQFKGFLREGKVTKAEHDKLNFAELSKVDGVALSALISSFENRKASTDIAQFGQEGARPVNAELSSKEFRKLSKAQASGKGSSVNLEQGDDEDDDKPKNKNENDLSSDSGIEKSDLDAIMSAMDKCMEGFDGVKAILAGLKSSASELEVEEVEENNEGEE